MKDRLENFVRNHRHDFDMLEPSDALWSGIEKKMDKGRKHKLSFYLSRVAAVAAIFIISLMVQQYFWGNRNEVNIPELQEAELYYSQLISMKLEQVKPLLSDNPTLEKELEHDLTELDSIYKLLREDLKDNIANQEVLEAMIENYRLRIDILEEMVTYLDTENNNTKNNNNSEYDL
ncbi:MAG TPA: hypothetical protein DDX98_02040 [Bacteroidales bacterium]|jgi:hypothetical protein|nr:hypothetical protein [Bacteroidales bacterium]